VIRFAEARISHQHQFHDAVVGWGACGLNNEDVLTADILVQLDGYFTIAKFTDIGVTQGNANMFGNLIRQYRICIARKDH